jgi:hypothetical protein
VSILAKSSSLGGIARLGLVTYRCIRVSSPGKRGKGEETTNGMPSVGDRVYPRGVAGLGLSPRGSQRGDTIGGRGTRGHHPRRMAHFGEYDTVLILGCRTTSRGRLEGRSDHAVVEEGGGALSDAGASGTGIGHRAARHLGLKGLVLDPGPFPYWFSSRDRKLKLRDLRC